MGRIAKPHGLAGEVVVDLVTNRTERLEAGVTLFTSASSSFTSASSSPSASASDPNSAVTELVVERSSRFGARWIVRFDGIVDREGAERARGWKLFAPPVEEAEALWVDELVGAEVFDQSGTQVGRVASVLANPASDLLELEGGGLIPLVFVTESGAGKVVVDIPEGLLE